MSATEKIRCIFIFVRELFRADATYFSMLKFTDDEIPETQTWVYGISQDYLRGMYQKVKEDISFEDFVKEMDSL